MINKLKKEIGNFYIDSNIPHIIEKVYEWGDDYIAEVSNNNKVKKIRITEKTEDSFFNKIFTEKEVEKYLKPKEKEIIKEKITTEDAIYYLRENANKNLKENIKNLYTIINEKEDLNLKEEIELKLALNNFQYNEKDNSYKRGFLKANIDSVDDEQYIVKIVNEQKNETVNIFTKNIKDFSNKMNLNKISII